MAAVHQSPLKRRLPSIDIGNFFWKDILIIDINLLDGNSTKLLSTIKHNLCYIIYATSLAESRLKKYMCYEMFLDVLSFSFR